MAERIHDPPEPKGYPWDEWTDGATWLVKQGVDYHCQSATFQSYLYRVAARRKMQVTTSYIGNGVRFSFKKGD